MKKLLLSAFAALACMGTASAEEAVFTFTGTGDVYGLTRSTDNNAAYYGTEENPATITEGGISITLKTAPFGTFSGSGVRLWSDGLRVMKNSGFIINAGGQTINKVVVTCVKANGTNSLAADADPAEFTLDATDSKVGSWEGTVTTLPIANDGTKGLKGTLAIASIAVTYGQGQTDTRKDAGLAFSAPTATATIGQPFTAPTLTKATNAAVTYTSSTPGVATVDATTGAVTLVAAGTTTITASAEANDQYKSGKATYELTVNAAPVQGEEQTLTFNFAENAYGCTVAGNSNSSYYMEDGESFSDGPLTITANKAEGSGVRFWATDAGVQTFRVNRSSAFKLSINEGTIVKVEMTGTNAGNFKADNGNFDSANLLWTGASSAVTFTNAGTSTIQLSTMTVTYVGGVADNRQDAGLSFGEETTFNVVLGEAFTAPTLTKATDAAVTYESSNAEVATVDAANGNVTILAAGTAVITAKAEANDQFKAGSASYTIIVKEPLPAGTIFTSELGEGFSWENSGELVIWKTNNYGLVGSGYISSKPNAAVAVAYTTEALDLTNKTNAELNFQTAFNNYKLNNVMIPVTDFEGYAYVVAREMGTEAWTIVTEMAAPESFSWNFYDAAPVALTAWEGKKIQLGFRYHSTDEVAGTWEIKNILVTAKDKESLIDEVEATDAPAEYYNLQGIRVDNPTSGLYIRRQGNTVTKVIL